MTAAGAGTPPAVGRWAVVLAGAVSLAVAMGIGRFAFTPLLPMMLHDGVIDLPSASWLASANYLGYLAGALLCTFQPWIWARAPGLPPIDGPWMVRAGLVATGVLTLGMALPWPALWPLLRFAAGVASAFVFIYASGWVLSQMVRLQAPALASVMYAGPGAGIVVSGLIAGAMVQWRWHALDAWLVFGLLAFLLSALVWRTLRGGESPQLAAAMNSAAGAVSERHAALEVGLLCFGYGIAGFGYIVTGTFLPVIARSALPDSPWLDMFWPIFGFGVFCGALIASRLRVNSDLRLLLAAGYLIQAAGIAVGVWSPSLAGFAIGSLMLGFPFTAITFCAMQEVRRLRPALAASFMGLATAMFGIGQICGPPLVALLLRQSGSAGAGFTLSLQIAMGALLAGALLFLWMVRAYPMQRVALA